MNDGMCDPLPDISPIGSMTTMMPICVEDMPCVLTIAGSDSGGGAGIQGDLKTFAAWHCYGASVITAVTAQNTCGVRSSYLLPADIIAAQLDAVLDDLPVRAIKVGMLGSAAAVQVVSERLRSRASDIPIVIDPVLAASDGTPLLEAEGLPLLRDELCSLATILTPNLPEASILLELDTVAEGRVAAHDLLALGGFAVLVKGGHGEGEELVDYLAIRGEGAVRSFPHPRIATIHTHGTGCALSSGIAAGLAHGLPVERAVAGAIDWLQQALARPLPIGHGHGPVHHLWELWERG
jgi:hydroxymethylpyrimidine/phosphomethylpyrimidine kinase